MAKKKKGFFLDFPNGYKIRSAKRSKKRVTARAPFYRRAYDQIGALSEGIREIGRIKENLRNMGWYLGFLVAGIALALFGLALYIECLCPQIKCGLSFFFVGLAAIVAALIYRRMS